MIVRGITFVLIFKNASTSVNNWLQNNFSNEIIYNNPGQIHPPIGTNASDVTCAVVRNPWDRVVSMWAYSNETDLKLLFSRAYPPMHRVPDKISFNEFVRNLAGSTLTNDVWFTLATPQVQWIPDGVTHLLRFETLDQDFKNIQEILGCDVPLPSENPTEHADYRTYYTDETRSIVAELFKEDIAAFGYEF